MEEKPQPTQTAVPQFRPSEIPQEELNAWEQFKPWSTHPNDVKYEVPPQSIHRVSAWDAIGPAFDLAFNDRIAKTAADFQYMYEDLANDNSRWLTPDEANNLYPTALPYRYEVKESIAKFNALMNHDELERDKLAKLVLSNIQSDTLGGMAIPFIASVAGGLTDPVTLVTALITSGGLSLLGRGALAVGATRTGKILTGGSLQTTVKAGKEITEFVRGGVGATLTSEAVKEAAITFAQEGARMKGKEAKNLAEFDFGDLAYLTAVGTVASTAFTAGSIGLAQLFKRRPKGSTAEIEDSIIETQLNSDVVPNIDAIERAHQEGLLVGYNDPHKRKANPSKPVESAYTVFEDQYKVLDSDVEFRVDPSGRAQAFLKGTNVQLVKNTDLTKQKLYLPLADISKEGVYQNYVTTTLLNPDSIQLTTSPIIARNAARHPLLFTKDTGKVKAMRVNNIKPVDVDAPLSSMKDIHKEVIEIFGRERFNQMIEDNVKLRDVILEAQPLGLNNIKKLQDAILREGNAMVYTEYPGTSKSYDVIEVFPNRKLDVDQLEHNINLNSPADNTHILKAQKEVSEYMQDPRNKITYDPDLEAALAEPAPKQLTVKQRLKEIDDRLAELNEKIDYLTEIEKVSREDFIDSTSVKDTGVKQEASYDTSYYRENKTSFEKETFKPEGPEKWSAKVRKATLQIHVCRRKNR